MSNLSKNTTNKIFNILTNTCIWLSAVLAKEVTTENENLFFSFSKILQKICNNDQLIDDASLFNVVDARAELTGILWRFPLQRLVNGLSSSPIIIQSHWSKKEDFKVMAKCTHYIFKKSKL